MASPHGQALVGRSFAAGVLDGDVSSWAAEVAAALAAAGYDPDAARVAARLALAVVRGLLVDVLATGEGEAVDAAFERFVSSGGARSGAVAPRSATLAR